MIRVGKTQKPTWVFGFLLFIFFLGFWVFALKNVIRLLDIRFFALKHVIRLLDIRVFALSHVIRLLGIFALNHVIRLRMIQVKNPTKNPLGLLAYVGLFDSLGMLPQHW